jgi:hypothetical protein
MTNQKALARKSTLTNTEAQENQFEGRGFAVQKKSDTHKSDLNTLLLQAKTFGHSISKLAGQESSSASPQTNGLSIQPKLSIGEPGDRYEQEADRVASVVVQRINAPSLTEESVQREAMPEEEEEVQMKPLADSIQRLEDDEEELQMKSLADSIQRVEIDDEEELQMKSQVQRQEAIGGGEASTDLESSINSARGGGQAIADNIRKPMEVAFGADFSGVKVHTDGQSDQLNWSIQARAFTTGQDVFFRQGEYNPGSRGGQELLAHELTHVVQQNGGAVMRLPQLPHEAGHEGTRDTGVINLPPNHITLGKLTGRIGTTERQEDVPVVQRALDQKTIEKNINIAALSASEYERLLYWNEDGKLDELKSQQVEVVKKKLLEWARKPHPKEKPEEESKQNTLPQWMNRYEQFSVSLPNHLGGGALTFRKRAEFVVFENRGWISNNKVIKIEGHKQSYMLHLILEWKDPYQETPNPHITIRTLEAQSNIILDTIAPRSEKRSQGLEATKSSLSVGIGNNERKQGDALNLPDEQEQNLNSEATLNWLKGRVIEEVKRAEIIP